MLRLRNIIKSFGQQVAVDQINLTFQSGQIHPLLGENSTGKLTLMDLIYALSQPSAGEIVMMAAPSGSTHPTRQ